MNDKYTESDIHLSGKTFEKFDNFWYYYKWHVIAAIFIIFVLAVCIFQSCTRETFDVNVLYAGPYAYTGSEKEAIMNDLSKIAPEDSDGNGEKSVGLITYNVMSKEQIEDLKAQLGAKEENAGLIVDTSYYTSESELYSSAIMTGHYAILLLDESLYQKLAEDEGRLRKLSDVFVTVPQSAFSEYGIRFSQTALYQNSELLGKLPESTVLCLLSPYVIGSTSNKTAYSQMVTMFMAMAADPK